MCWQARRATESADGVQSFGAIHFKQDQKCRAPATGAILRVRFQHQRRPRARHRLFCVARRNQLGRLLPGPQGRCHTWTCERERNAFLTFCAFRLQVGDQIVRINGFSVEFAIHREVLQLIQSSTHLYLRVRSEWIFLFSELFLLSSLPNFLFL